MQNNYLRKAATSLALALWVFVASGQINNTEVFNANYPQLNDGKIIINTTNFVPPTTYIWSNGETTKNIFSLSPGLYSVTVTDAINQSDTADFNIGITNNNYHFPWHVTTSSSTHTIQVPSNGVTIKGQAPLFGDEIGVFYDSLGFWACAGSIIWTGNTQTITVYGDTAGDAGFEQNEKFRFLIRSQLYDIDFIADATYDFTTYTSDSLFASGGTSGITSLAADSLVLQTSLMLEGTNNFILNYDPVDGSAHNVFNNPFLFGGFGSESLLVLDPSSGFIYWTFYGLYTITEVLPGNIYETTVSSNIIFQTACYLTDTTYYSINPNTCYNTTDGNIALTTTFGIPPYSYLWNTGETSQLITNIPSNTSFTVTITDSQSSQQILSINTGGQPMVPSFDIATSNASPSSGGTIEIVNMNWLGANGYNWSNGGTGPVQSNLIAGNYQVTISNYLGCLFDTSVTISTSAFNANLAKNDVSCYGLNDGSAWLENLTGTPPYTYSWSTGSTSDSIFGLESNLYTVTIIDANTNTNTLGIFIDEPDSIGINFSVYPVSTQGMNDGSIAVNPITGGTYSYSYQWSTGSTSHHILQLTEGTYTLTVNDGNGCSIVESYYVGVQASPPSVILSMTNILCNGLSDGSAWIDSISGVSPFSYGWSTGSTTDSIFGLAAGSYSITVTDDNANTTVEQFTITQPDPISMNSVVVNIDPTNSILGSIETTPNGGAPPYYFAWSNGESTQNISGLSAGNYGLTLTDANGCLVSDNFTVLTNTYFWHEVLNANTPQLNDGYLLLSPDTTLLEPITYNWSNGAISKNLINLAPGTYTLTFTDATGFTSQQDFEVGISDNSYAFDWFVTPSSDAHTLSIPGGNAVTIKGQPLLLGDKIGVFYDSLGYWACAGSIVWTGNAQTLTVYGDTAGNTGLEANEEFRFLIRSELYDIDFIATAQYNLSPTFSNDSTFIAGGTSGLLSLSADELVLQTHLQSKGWNLFNAFYDPLEPNMEEILNTPYLFAPYDTVNEILAKSTNGNIYWSKYGLNTIGNIITGENYQLYISKDCIFQNEAMFNSSSYYTMTPAYCLTGQDGVISMTPVFGTPPYTYNWNTGETSQWISGLMPGSTYSVTITDALSAQQTHSIPMLGTAGLPPALNLSTTIDSTMNVMNIGAEVIYFQNPIYVWSNGETNNELFNLPISDYSLTVYDENGCSIDTTISPSTLSLDANLNTSDILCYGLNNGSAWLDNISGFHPFSIGWSTGETSDSISGLALDSYSVTITDGNANTQSFSFDILESDSISITSTITDQNTATSQLGAIDISVTGATSPYLFEWSNYSSSEDIYNLVAGTYTLTITDANLCTFIDSFEVNNFSPSTLTVFANTSNIPCYGNCIGAIDLSVSGGTTPYSYVWSNGETTEDLFGLCAGTYEVTVSDSGTVNTYSYEITQPDEILVYSSITLVNPFIGNNGTINLTVSGGVTPYTFSWSNGETTEDLDSLASGTYHLTLYDGNFCSYMDSFAVDSLSNYPTVFSSSITNILCYGDCTGAIDLTVTGGNTPYNFVWSNGEGTEDIAGLCAGTYNVNIFEAGVTQSGTPWPWSYNITASNHTLLISPGTITINGSTPPTGSYLGVFYSDNGILKCGGYTEWTGTTTAISAWADDSGSSTKLGFANGETFQWQVYANGISYLAQAQYNTSMPNTSTFAINGMSSITSLATTTGAFSSYSYTITQANEIIFSSLIIPEDTSIGNNGAIDLTVTGGTSPYAFIWSNGETTEDLSGLTAGFYPLTLTDANTCMKTEVFEVATSPTTPLTVSGTTTDALCNTSCDGNIDLSVTGGTSPYTFVWSNGETTEDITGLCAGSYTVTVGDQQSSTGGTSSPMNWNYFITATNHTILIQPNTVFINGDSIQTGDYLGVFYDNNGTLECGGYTQWQGNNTHSITAWGDDSGSAIKDGFAIGEAFTFKVWRAASSTLLEMTASYLTTSFPNQEFFTANGMSGISSLTGTSTSNVIVQSFTVLEPDSMIISSIITDATDSTTANGAIDIIVTGGTTPYNFVWSNGETTEDLLNLLYGTYSLTVTDANGCYNSETINLPISTPNIQVITSQAFNDSCYQSCTGAIDLTVTGGSNPVFFDWSNGETTEDISNLCEGSYDVTISNTQNTGAYGTWTYTITSDIHTILLPTYINIDGTPAPAGSLVGIFYQDGSNFYCGGYAEYFGGLYNSLSAFGDDPLTPNKDGFYTGDEFYFGIQTPTGTNFTLAALFDQTASNAGTFTPSGLSTVSSFVTPTSSNLNFIITQPDSIEINAQINSTIIGNPPEGVIDITTSGGTQPYNFAWSNGETTEDIDSLAGGVYELTLTDANGCLVNESYTVLSIQQLSINLGSTPISGAGNNDGMAWAITSGGLPPYSYSWTSTSANNDTIFNLSSGFYYVTVSDAANNQTLGHIYVGGGPLELSIATYHASETGASNGMLIPIPSGGTTPFSYAWSSGATSDTLAGLAAGSYSLTISDLFGAQATAEQQVYNNANRIWIEFEATPASSTTSTDGAIDLYCSGGLPPYDYLWSTGATTDSLDNLSYGLYQVWVTDAAGITDSSFIYINSDQQMNFTWTNTGNNHSMLIPDTVLASINGANLEVGDLIGVFFEDGGTIKCAGYTTWTGNMNYVTMWGDDDTTPILKEGFNIAESINWFVRDVSANQDYNVSARYFDIGFDNFNHYFKNGISGCEKLGDPTPAVDLDLFLNSPMTRCDMMNSDSINVTVTNSGSHFATNFSLSYSLPLGINVTEFITDTIPAGGSLNYTFTTQYDGSVYIFEEDIWMKVYSSCTEDQNPTNDTISTLGAASWTNVFPYCSIQNDVMSNCLGSINIDSFYFDSTNFAWLYMQQYHWDQPGYNQVLSRDSLCSGTYTFSWTDGTCWNSTDIEIDDEPLMLQFDITPPTCSGMSNGALNAYLNFPTGGNYTYLWNTGDTSTTISNMSPGTYSLTVNESGTFLLADTVIMPDPSPIVTSASVQHITNNTNPDGAIDLTVSGGIMPYSFNWSSGSTAEDPSGLQAGTHIVYLTDGNGCTAQHSKYVSYVSAPAPLAVSSTFSDVNCNGICDGEINLTTSGGLAPCNFEWSNGETSEDISGLCAGNYEVRVSSSTGSVAAMPWVHFGANPWGDQSFGGDVTVNGVNASPGDYIGAFVNINGNYVCAGYKELVSTYLGTVSGSISMHPDNPATPQKDGFENGDLIHVKLWRQSDGKILDLIWDPMQWYGSSNPTTYMGQGYGSAPLSGTYSTPSFSPLQIIENFEITEPDPIAISETITHVDPAIGTDGAIDLSVMGGSSPYTFAWSNGETTEDLSNLATGTFTVTVTDQNLCTVTASVSVDFTYTPLPLQVSDIITHISCYSLCDGAIDLTVSGGAVPYEFAWSSGITTENANGLCPGQHTITITCPSETLTLSYTITQPDEILGNGVITDVTPSIGNDGAIDLSPSGGTPPYSFTWSNSETTEDIAGLGYGEYIVTISDANLCDKIDTFMVNYSGNYLLYDMLAQSPNCFGQASGSAWIGNLVGVPPFLYLWSNGATSDSIAGLMAGTYEVTVTAGNNDVISQSVEVLPATEVIISMTVTMADPVTNAPGAIDVEVTAGLEPYSYAWSNGETTQDLVQAEYGNYQLSLTYNNVCTALADTFVDFNLLPNWTFDHSGDSHSIDVPQNANLQINGVDLELNDFIGVFYDDNGNLACGGYAIWKQNATTVYAYADNPTTGVVDGFAANDQFEWIIWDASINQEHFAAASYDTTYTHLDLWQANGQSGLDSLQTVTISGTVATGSKSLLPMGMLVLYQPSQGSYYAIDKGLIQNGQFEIEGIMPGDYMLYAIPQPGNNYGIPGYYVQYNNWQNASMIQAHGYTGGIDITIDPVMAYTTGSGAISGNVYVGSDASYNPDVFGEEWFPSSTKEGEEPARNIPIILFDAQLNPMDFRLSNDQGAFEFEQLELGSYLVKVEKAGLQSEQIPVTLSAQSPTSDGLNFTLDEGQVISVQEIVEHTQFEVYPNPTSDVLYIELKENISDPLELKIYTLTGQEINIPFSTNKDLGNRMELDISDLSQGVYLIELSNSSSKFIRKITKQ